MTDRVRGLFRMATIKESESPDYSLNRPLRRWGQRKQAAICSLASTGLKEKLYLKLQRLTEIHPNGERNAKPDLISFARNVLCRKHH